MAVCDAHRSINQWQAVDHVPPRDSEVEGGLGGPSPPFCPAGEKFSRWTRTWRIGARRRASGRAGARAEARGRGGAREAHPFTRGGATKVAPCQRWQRVARRGANRKRGGGRGRGGGGRQGPKLRQLSPPPSSSMQIPKRRKLRSKCETSPPPPPPSRDPPSRDVLADSS